jgi:hypothetical protein
MQFHVVTNCSHEEFNFVSKGILVALNGEEWNRSFEFIAHIRMF